MVLDQPTLDRLYRGLSETHAWLDKYYAAMNNGNQQQRQSANMMLKRTIDQLGVLTRQFQQAGLQAGPSPKAASLKDLMSFMDFLDKNSFYALAEKVSDVIKLGLETKRDDLISLANFLDENNLLYLANKVDEIGKLYITAEYGFIPIERSDQENEANDGDDIIQPTREGSLSTRYCPDHRGVQAIRIAEKVYQCPIDGKKYDYEMGYENYKGQKIPGGSVAAQTPATSDFGGIPMRIWDSRSDVLNRIN